MRLIPRGPAPSIWRILVVVAAVLFASAAAIASVGGASSKRKPHPCSYSRTGATGSPLKRAVKLTPDPSAAVVNFAGSGGSEFVDVVLNATPALPASVRSSQIRLEVLRRFTRTSQTARTEAAPTPTFTQPRISPNRDRITFTACLNGSGLKAGSYAGNVYIEGPPGLSPVSVSITENATNADLAAVGTIAALALAFVFLWLRGAAARQVAAEQVQAEQLVTAAKAYDTDRIDEATAAAPKPVGAYLLEVFKDLNWLITTLVALGAAFGTIVGIYDSNPAWGVDTLGSVISLVGPAFTAVGVQSVVASLGRSVTKT